MDGHRPARTPPRRRAGDWPASTPTGAKGAVSEALDSAARAQAETALAGDLPGAVALADVSELGRRAAEEGTAAESLIDQYIRSTRQAWHDHRPPLVIANAAAVHEAADALLHTAQTAVTALVAGHQAARQRMIRHEEAVRKEFVDDLLRGDADVAGMVQRAQPFGLDLTSGHHVALAEPATSRGALEQPALRLERAVVDRYGDREVLVATKDQRIVVIVPGAAEQVPDATESTIALSRFLDEQLQHRSGEPWRIGSGRAFRGAFGVARSYEEARETLELGARLGLATPALDPGHVLTYRVLTRDQAAIIDLVHTVLGPLSRTRGGAGPLLETLQTYFDCGANATHTARRIHLSVRAVTYRLARVNQLTGYNPTHPEQRFVLQTAALGARLLGWPARPLPHTP